MMAGTLLLISGILLVARGSALGGLFLGLGMAANLVNVVRVAGRRSGRGDDGGAN